MVGPTCPMVQWDSQLGTMDSDGRLRNEGQTAAQYIVTRVRKCKEV